MSAPPRESDEIRYLSQKAKVAKEILMQKKKQAA